MHGNSAHLHSSGWVPDFALRASVGMVRPGVLEEARCQLDSVTELGVEGTSAFRQSEGFLSQKKIGDLYVYLVSWGHSFD